MPDNEAVTGVPETQAPATESATEETKAPAENVEVEAQSPDQGTGETEDISEAEWGKLSEKARKRFQKVTKENAELKERQRLFDEAQAKERYTQAGVPQSQESDFTELTPEQLTSFVDQRVFAKTKEQEISNDYESVKEIFPTLNPAKPDYNRELDEFLTEGYSAAVKGTPKLRLKDYVSKRMELLTKAQQKGQAEITTKTMQQMSETPIKTEQSAEKKSPSDDLKSMSLDEMRKVLPHVEY